jgi:glycosyltransferase involved in cell wall biosynthesis
LKIAVIAPSTIPAQTANSIQVMKMAQALSALGHKVRLFAPGGDPQVGWKQIAKHYGLREKFKIRWVAARSFLRRYDYALGAVREAGAWGADIVYTRVPQAAALAARRRMRTIFELHDMPSGTMGPWLTRAFIRAKNAKRLVVNTSNLEKEVKAMYNPPSDSQFLLLAPNGVDLERYAKLPASVKARSKLGLRQGFTAGYSGNLYRGRGSQLILDMARLLPHVNFLLVGGREHDVERIRADARHLSNVHLVGFVGNEELPLYQAAADVLLLPYGQKVEASSGGDIAAFTNPLKMFEYLASGRAILASNLPILREVLNQDNAIILPGQNVEEWVAALERLYRSPKQREALAKAARETAARFSWEKRAENLMRGL